MADAVTVPQPVSFSSMLRGFTQEDHQKVEATLGLPHRLRSEADLGRLLLAWDTVWVEVRAAVQGERHPAGHDECARLLVSAVRALNRIHADLGELGLEAGLLTSGRDRARDGDSELAGLLSSEPGVWAVSYVLRGSRLGCCGLASMISKQLELPAGVAMSYHSDEAARPSWNAFRQRLDAWGRVAQPAAREHALDVGRVTFRLIGARLAAALPVSRRRSF